MKMFKKLGKRASPSVPSDWRSIIAELNTAGPDMTTTFYGQPVPMNLCSVCAHLFVEMEGSPKSKAVRSPKMLFSEHNCDMCRFFAPVLDPVMLSTLKHWKQGHTPK